VFIKGDGKIDVQMWLYTAEVDLNPDDAGR